ncbi:hypothetical protein ACFL0M_03615 [Thermodesulfobacteriota bacterium]
MLHKIESFGSKILKTKKIVLLAWIIAIIATISLAMIQYFYLPLSVDGGWYSYPALALSRGGDPGENRLNVEELQKIKGIKTAFRQDFRQSVRVLPMSWWFRFFGTNFWTVKLFGILELLILISIFHLLLRRICKNSHIVLLCSAIYLMDGQIISLGASNLRADIMLAIMTLLVFLLTRLDGQKYPLILFISGIFSISFLALTRITSVIPLAFLIVYMTTEIFLSWKKFSNFKKIFYFSLSITGIMTFSQRIMLWNIFLPSEYIHFHSGFRAPRFIKAGLTRDIFLTIEKELNRWTDYFFLSNLGEFFSILLALLLFILYLFGPSSKRSMPIFISIPVGCIFAIGIMTMVGPFRTSWPAHAIPIVPFFILMLALGLTLSRSPKIKYWSVSFLFVLVLLSAGIKFAQSGRIITRCIRIGYSNMDAVKFINNIFKPKNKGFVVVGPTELWPYFNPETNIVIIDIRRRPEAYSKFMDRVDFIILNKDYLSYNWENRFRDSYPDIKLKTIAEIGEKNVSSPFLKIIKPSL